MSDAKSFVTIAAGTEEHANFLVDRPRKAVLLTPRVVFVNVLLLCASLCAVQAQWRISLPFTERICGINTNMEACGSFPSTPKWPGSSRVTRSVAMLAFFKLLLLVKLYRFSMPIHT